MFKISDALPVQFYLDGEPSFNEKIEQGIEHHCFFQPFNCDDLIKLQFTDDNFQDYTLKVLDKDGNELAVLACTTTDPNESESFDTSAITAGTTHNTPFGGVTNWSSAQVTLTYAGGPPANVLAYSKRFPVDIPAGDVTIDLELNLTLVSGSPTSTLMWVRLLDASLNVVGIVSIDTGIITQALYPSVTITASADVAYIDLQPRLSSVAAASFRTLVDAMTVSWVVDYPIFAYSASLVPEDESICNQYIKLEIYNEANELVAYSDLLDIKSSHKHTNLIQYSNETDFAGLIYEGITPTPWFAIRVTSKFFKRRNPQEDESESLSDGSVVKLLGTAKKQRLLQVEPAPPYMHDKLTLILQHNTIYMDNLSWVKEEAYETEELDEYSAMSLGKAWLTQASDNYVTNPFS